MMMFTAAAQTAGLHARGGFWDKKQIWPIKWVFDIFAKLQNSSFAFCAKMFNKNIPHQRVRRFDAA